MGFYLAVSLQYVITMFAPNTGPWASIRKKTAKQIEAHEPLLDWTSGRKAPVLRSSGFCLFCYINEDLF